MDPRSRSARATGVAAPSFFWRKCWWLTAASSGWAGGISNEGGRDFECGSGTSEMEIWGRGREEDSNDDEKEAECAAGHGRNVTPRQVKTEVWRCTREQRRTAVREMEKTRATAWIVHVTAGSTESCAIAWPLTREQGVAVFKQQLDIAATTWQGDWCICG